MSNGDPVEENLKLEDKPKKTHKHDSGAADLEKVTDYAEEKEITSGDFKGAMTLIGDRRSKEKLEKAAREKELAKISIKKEDVELIISQFEVTRSVAERTLREHRGNLVQALISLTD